MSDARKKPKNLSAHLSRMSVAALEKLLVQGRSLPEAQQDKAFLDAVEQAILEKELESPVGFLPDAETAWNTFQQTCFSDNAEHERYFDSRSFRKVRFSKLSRKITVVAATLVLLLALLIVAQADTQEAYCSKASWNGQSFVFEEGILSRAELEEGATILDHVNLQDLQELCLPDYWIDDIGMVNSNTHVTIDCCYKNSDGDSYWVVITEQAGSFQSMLYEKDENEVEYYTVGDKRYYLFTNLKTNVSAWSNGQITLHVYGRIPMEQIKIVLDKIG